MKRNATDGAPEAPNGYHDPQGRAKKQAEDQRLQNQYNKLCGPVSVRRIGEEKKDA